MVPDAPRRGASGTAARNEGHAGSIHFGANAVYAASLTQQRGDDATTVRIHFDVPVIGIKPLLKPLFPMGVRKATVKALEENRIDLEQRGYPRAG
jgi:hypothetical protein